jgi:hypothetical protein
VTRWFRASLRRPCRSSRNRPVCRACDKGMAETVAAEMPSKAQIDACKWLTEDDLAVYATEYTRTGFQGGLGLLSGS